MKPRNATPALAALMSLGTASLEGLACGPCGDMTAFLAVSDDREEATAAIATLRDRGPVGLQEFLAEWGSTIDRYAALVAAGSPELSDPSWARLTRAIDGVGAQRDNYAATLYWYTDLDKARAASKESGRPILSLRLLGRLDDELSCANSRFMRTALYANQEVSGILRDRFILHWQSVRPVPKISIDFGDGRTLVRTVTGNSLHYVLDDEGRPIDALPGLYGPGSFKTWLERMQLLHAQLMASEPESAPAILADYHAGRIARIALDWKGDLAAAGHAEVAGNVALPGREGAFPEALVAAQLTVSKAAVESPIIAAMRVGASLERAMSDPVWEDLARLRLDEARLDEASLGVMSCKTAATPEMVQGFERLIAEDAVRNEYLNHRRIHEWLAGGAVIAHQDLTERIYADLFLTPSADPWLGLVGANDYAALDGNGISRDQ
jgi:hypothetical protein